MPREAKDVTEAELAILRRLWGRGKLSIRQLTDALHPDGDAAQYATVKKQLERMEAKKLVRRDRSLFVHLFEPAVQREELLGRRLRDLAERFCEGSFAPILGFLGKTKALSAIERQELRKLIDDWETDEAAKRKRSRKE